MEITPDQLVEAVTWLAGVVITIVTVLSGAVSYQYVESRKSTIAFLKSTQSFHEKHEESLNQIKNLNGRVNYLEGKSEVEVSVSDKLDDLAKVLKER